MKCDDPALQPVIDLIKQGKFDEAHESEQQLASGMSAADVEACIEDGVESFNDENYGCAAANFGIAFEARPDDEDLRTRRDHADANAVSGIKEFHPPEEWFEDMDLMDLPKPIEHQLPGPRPPLPKLSILLRIYRGVGWFFGWIGSFFFKHAGTVVGGLFGYTGKIWTKWYRRKKALGILTLAYMRDRLNKKNLKNTYPDRTEEDLTGFADPALKELEKRPEGVEHFRTADGSWNNLENPLEGAAFTRFQRNVAPEAAQPETGDRLMTPNPREISLRLLRRPDDEMQKVDFLNMLAASWIQFQNHDWVNHGDVLTKPDVFEIPFGEDDPARKLYNQECMFVGKTQPDPTHGKGNRSEEPYPATFINEVTHWWDGSQIYGSDEKTVQRLRSGVDGKMKINETDGTLPLDKKGLEDTGFVRNWWVGLAMLHNVFVLEHNAICDHLKNFYPHWDDERLFQVARLVNAAVMAKIHTVEWTPAVLPNPGLDTALNANWFGLLTNLFKKGLHRQTLAAINIRNPELGGVVGNKIDKHGQPYGLTQEFVEVYRLHSFLPEKLEFKHVGEEKNFAEISLPATRQAGSRRVTEQLPMHDLFYSFGTQQPGLLVLRNYPRFMQELSLPGNPVFDLAAVDILRARERGVPRYNEFRSQLGLKPIETFEDLNTDAELVKELKEVYDDKVEDLDLLVGTLAEEHRPTNFGFGETLFQIFILNATRRLQADRFYTTDYNEQTYTREGLEWIDNITFKNVLLRHYPELANTGLANIKNAFEPWDEGELDPKRHPLRGCDPELKDNPTLGDRQR